MDKKIIDKIIEGLRKEKEETIPYSRYKKEGFEYIRNLQKKNYNSKTKEIQINYFPNLLLIEFQLDGKNLLDVFVTHKRDKTIWNKVFTTDDDKGILRVLDKVKTRFRGLIQASTLNELEEQLAKIKNEEDIEVVGKKYKITVNTEIVSYIDFAESLEKRIMLEANKTY